MVHKQKYDDVRKLIYYQARRFYLRYGGDFDDIVGQSLLIFIQASLKFKLRHGNKFSSYIANKIWHGLIDYHKKYWKHPQPLLEDIVTERFISIPSYSDRAMKFKIELVDSLGQNARLVVRHIFNPDRKLKAILRYKEGKRIERRAIRQYLIKHRGWTHNRVDNAFWELQKALR